MLPKINKQTLKQWVNTIQKEKKYMETHKHESHGHKHALKNKNTKPNTPIRHIVNWKNVPTYEIAK